MPTTPTLALPYPALSDTADVPRDIQALATKLDGYSSLRPPAVSSLPASPVDGQECYFTADAANGVQWHLRYRAAASGPYKWEVIGGASLYAEVAAQQPVTGGGAFADPATAGPQITVPLAGDYDMVSACLVFNTAASGGANGLIAAPKIGAAAAVDTDAIIQAAVPFGTYTTAGRTIRRTVPAAASLVKLQYRILGAGTVNTGLRVLNLMPVRVG